MAEGDTRAFVLAILRALQAVRDGHPWAAAVMRNLSGLRSAAVWTLCTAITVGHLAWVTVRRMAGRVAIAVIEGAALMTLLVGPSRGVLACTGRPTCWPAGPAGHLMKGGRWHGGWMGGHGGAWTPILRVAIVGLLAWTVMKRRK